LRLGRGEGVEDGGFSDVGETDDSAVQWHVFAISLLRGLSSCFRVASLSLTG
jgi:hypothetical protein